MNSKAKGERNERKARDVLQAAGFKVEKSKNSRFGNSDYFNQFDLMGLKSGMQPVFVQVKSNGWGGVKNSLREWCLKEFPVVWARCEMWSWFDYKGWKVLRLNSGDKGWIWSKIVDETEGNCDYMGVDVKKVR